MKCNSKNLLIITLAYIYIPIALFLLGYTAAWIWIVTIGAMAYYVRGMYKDYAADMGDDIFISWPVLTAVILVISVICVMLGYGGLFEQAGDWFKHNAVLHDLVRKDWPVYYTEHEESMLTYYLGQYIVPATFGKLAGLFVYGELKADISFRAAEIAMALWGIAGIVLVYLNLIRVTVADSLKKQIRLAWILMFFSGALPLAQLVINDVFGENMYSLGSHHWLLANGLMIQYRSNMVMLRWVFPQVIVIWLIVVLFMENKDKINHYVLLLLPILLYGTFSIIIMAVVAACYAVYKLVVDADKKATLLKVLSLSNIVSFLTLGSVLISYLWGYIQVAKPAYMGFMPIDNDVSKTATILIFDFFMFGIYSVIVFRRQKKSVIYYVVNWMLLIIPFFKMGVFNDWVMGSSIPGLFIILIYVAEMLNHGPDDANEKNTKAYYVSTSVLLVILVIGSWYPAMELLENSTKFSPRTNMSGVWETLENYSDRESEESEDMLYNYYTYDLEGKFFYEHIAANKIGEASAFSLSGSKPLKRRVEGIYFDTYVSIVAYDNTSEDVLNGALGKCEEYSRIFDMNSADSELYRINNREDNISEEAGVYKTVVSEDMRQVIEAGLNYGELTEGRFDIAMGGVSQLWDFHSGNGIVPQESDINEALRHVDYNSLWLEDNVLTIADPQLMLDLGGIAKGYIANSLKEYFVSNGSSQVIIALGGNIMCIGDKAGEGYTVGVQKPYAGVGETVSTLNVKDTSVVSSGTYERYIEEDGIKYHHILNPVTGYSANTDIAGVTIVCRDSMKADVISTTVLMLGKEYGMEFLNTINQRIAGEKVSEAVFVDDNGNLEYWYYENEEK